MAKAIDPKAVLKALDALQKDADSALKSMSTEAKMKKAGDAAAKLKQTTGQLAKAARDVEK